VKLVQTIPALPVTSVTAAAEVYRDQSGWRQRPADDLADCPVRSGAEDFIAGTGSCRIACDDIDALYAELAPTGTLHQADSGETVATDWGTRGFHVVDRDGNLLTFFGRRQPGVG
jgi:hypothetical protein